MEIGSLAEWVESFAEILAVSVALFLPYYQKRKANKEKISRQNRSSLKLRVSFYTKRRSKSRFNSKNYQNLFQST